MTRQLYDEVQVGRSEIFTLPIGVGTMAWSNSRLWGYGDRLDVGAAAAAFEAGIAAGITLFDTAEVYGGGSSERVLGELLRRARAPQGAGGAPAGAQGPPRPRPLVATKFAPLPWRLLRRAVIGALDRSLARLGLREVDLYQVHFPGPAFAMGMIMDSLAEVVETGRTRSVGVSNFGADDLRRAYDRLGRRGIPLVSDQVEYSLLARSPQTDGVLDACRDLGMTLIAYSPLGRGALGGRYRPGASVHDVLRRRFPQFRPARLAALAPLIERLGAIGEAHGGRTAAQVALAWLIRQPGVIAIPGAKSAAQAVENAGALELRLGEDEVARLDSLSLGLRTATRR